MSGEVLVTLDARDFRRYVIDTVIDRAQHIEAPLRRELQARPLGMSPPAPDGVPPDRL